MNVEKVFSLYVGFDSLYGPYTRKDGRKHVVLRNTKTKELRTVSYPKLLVELREGRLLSSREQVDHEDRNKTNDDLSNLVIRNLGEHQKLDAKRVNPVEVSCVFCSTLFNIRHGQRKPNQPGAGPFCSKKCSGKYGKEIQSGGQPLERFVPEKTYFYLEK